MAGEYGLCRLYCVNIYARNDIRRLGLSGLRLEGGRVSVETYRLVSKMKRLRAVG